MQSGLEKLKSNLQDQGMVLFKSENAEELLSIGSSLGSIHFHPDSDATGLTKISHKIEYDDINASSKNKLGLTQGELIPHTDRSGVDFPPKYLIFWMEKQANIGGHSLLLDGHEFFEQLSTHGDPASIELLMRPKSVIFRNETSFLESSFFCKVRDSLMVRFRLDHMVYTSPDVSNILENMVKKILTNSIKLKLQKGEGYILDNHRWLHGRTQFIGDRLAYRLLVD
jgi:alpha-ketoglutarate-dependent taurine dioxygenase